VAAVLQFSFRSAPAFACLTIFAIGCAVHTDAESRLKENYSDGTFIECGIPEKFSLGPYDGTEMAATEKSLWFKGLPGERYDIQIQHEGTLPVVSLVGPDGADDEYVTQNRHSDLEDGLPFEETMRIALPAEGLYEIRTTEDDFEPMASEQISNFVVEISCDAPPYRGDLGCGERSTGLLDDFRPEHRYEFTGAEREPLTLRVSFPVAMSAPKLTLISETSGEPVPAFVRTESHEHGGLSVLESTLPSNDIYELVVTPGESFGGFEIDRPCASIAITDTPGW